MDKKVYDKYISKANLHPGIRFTPPKPINTSHSFEDLWTNWAEKRIEDGKTLEVEHKYNGQLYVLQWDGNKELIYSEDNSINKDIDFSEVVEELKKVGPVILEGNILVEDMGGESRIVLGAFDILYFDGKDLTDLSLSKRHQILEKVVKETNIIVSHIHLCKTKEQLQKAIELVSHYPFSDGAVVKTWDSTFKFEVNSEWSKIEYKDGDNIISVDRQLNTQEKAVEKAHILTIPKKKKYILKYGTSAGALAAWDTRGRGTSEAPTTTKERIRNEHLPYKGRDRVKQIQKDTGVEKSNIQDIVNLLEWQKLREELVGQWIEQPIKSIQRLKEFLGSIKETDNRKLRIIENYLTGSGFRSGNIKHPEIDKLLEDVKTEINYRRENNRWDEKMETVPEMSPEIGHPTQLITEKPKKKIKIRLRITRKTKK